VQAYLSSWFACDLAASFPLDYILVAFNTTGSNKMVKNILRLLKLPRLLRLGRLLKFLARFKYAGAVKILKFIFMLILVAHWTGCFFFFLCQIEDEYGHSTWMEHNIGHVGDGEVDVSSNYMTLLYTGFLMLIGEGMDMETDVEKLYGSMVVLVGTIVIAVIVGNVSFVVSNQNSTSAQYQSKIDMITDEMRALHLPGELQDRTLAYYDYLWNRHRTFDPACIRFTEDLSPTLRTEILLHMNRDCVLNCDFFRDVSNSCILRLVESFKIAVFLAHDVLADEGEPASDLVFVIHGSATVTKRGRIMPVSLLTPGDYFGEKSLLMHHRNAVSVVATENCDTRVLEKIDFEELSIDFPELKESILKRSEHMDVTEYDKHTKRRTLDLSSKSKHGGAGGLTSEQKAVLSEISQDVDVEAIKSSMAFGADQMVTPLTPLSKGGSRTSNKKENKEREKDKRMLEMYSTISAMNEELETMSHKQTQRDEDASRMLRKQEKLENQMFELNQKVSKLLSFATSGSAGNIGSSSSSSSSSKKSTGKIL
jgi:CRP-like cAMP-binding protein